jgi:hypothetical protein
MDEPNEKTKPVTWLEDLSELIQRKRAENEMLKKLGGMVANSDSNQDEISDANAEIRKEQKK